MITKQECFSGHCNIAPDQSGLARLLGTLSNEDGDADDDGKEQ